MTLRELTREDLPRVTAWRQHRSVVDSLGAPFRHIGPEVDQAWFDQYQQRRGVDVRCAICLEPEAPPVGLVSLTGIDPVHRHAEFHILIGDADARGRGVATEATVEILRHAFFDLNLHRVYLTVLASNAAAIRVYEKAGFKREGVLREAAFKQGSYCDLLLMAILRCEFNPS